MNLSIQDCSAAQVVFSGNSFFLGGGEDAFSLPLALQNIKNLKTCVNKNMSFFFQFMPISPPTVFIELLFSKRVKLLIIYYSSPPPRKKLSLSLKYSNIFFDFCCWHLFAPKIRRGLTRGSHF